MKLVHWQLMGGLLRLVQRGAPAWAAAVPPSPLIAAPNVTAHPSTASVPITVLLYDGPLRCDFNVGIKGLICYVNRAAKGPFIATQLSSTRRRVELSCVAINGP